jgi:hydrogenase-4 component H
MLRIIGAALRIGRVTASPAVMESPAPPATKGRPHLDRDRCDANGACQDACPSGAIALGDAVNGQRSFSLDYGACVFCGRCAAVCAPGALTITADYALATARREDLILRTTVKQ